MSSGVIVDDLLSKLRSRKVSRNRNFELFQQPDARRVLRLHRMLQRLERDLMRHAERATSEIRLEIRNAKACILMDDASLRLKRRIYLSPEELELLLEHPAIANLLLRADETQQRVLRARSNTG